MGGRGVSLHSILVSLGRRLQRTTQQQLDARGWAQFGARTAIASAVSVGCRLARLRAPCPVQQIINPMNRLKSRIHLETQPLQEQTPVTPAVQLPTRLETQR